jgi:4-hydroxybenzoate polyprenyltransferase
MVFTTFLLNGIHPRLTPYTTFIFFSTFLLYNFHTITFRLDYSGGPKDFIHSFLRLEPGRLRLAGYTLIFLLVIVNFFLLPAVVRFLIVPVTLVSLLYSIPLAGIRTKIRLREILFLKTPLLALVWSLSTVMIPMAEAGIPPGDKPVLIQTIARFLFIFALCIPFEIRDLNYDRGKNIRTIPVVYGAQATRLLGVLIITAEILINHFLAAYPGEIRTALDISSLIALAWIFVRSPGSPFFYKLIVDGTMLVRFMLVYLAIHSS